MDTLNAPLLEKLSSIAKETPVPAGIDTFPIYFNKLMDAVIRTAVAKASRSWRKTMETSKKLRKYIKDNIDAHTFEVPTHELIEVLTNRQFRELAGMFHVIKDLASPIYHVSHYTDDAMIHAHKICIPGYILTALKTELKNYNIYSYQIGERLMNKLRLALKAHADPTKYIPAPTIYSLLAPQVTPTGDWWGLYKRNSIYYLRQAFPKKLTSTTSKKITLKNAFIPALYQSRRAHFVSHVQGSYLIISLLAFLEYKQLGELMWGALLKYLPSTDDEYTMESVYGATSQFSLPLPEQSVIASITYNLDTSKRNAVVQFKSTALRNEFIEFLHDDANTETLRNHI